MHYVKHFNINGVDTKQVACIELQGAPNAATEGAVGVLGMDMSSPTHDVYRCVAVNGSVYTWELLSSGMSIICAIITYEGSERATFEYTDLRIPNNYLIKSGDLILDADGYLYQITAIGNSSCATEHCGIHLSNKSTSKDYNLRVKDGVLQLVTENGNVINNIDYLLADGKTIYRDPNTGKASVLGIRTITNELLYFFVGTQDEYDALTEAQKQNLFAIITDDPAKEELFQAIADIKSGKLAVGKSKDLEHLYLHSVGVKMNLYHFTNYQEQIGVLTLKFNITSPRSTITNSEIEKLIKLPDEDLHYYEGIYAPLTGASETIVGYQYHGVDTAIDMASIGIRKPSGDLHANLGTYTIVSKSMEIY